MVKTVYSLFPLLSKHKYGFESTMACRSQVLESIPDVKSVAVYTEDDLSDYQSRAKSFGIVGDVVYLLNSFCDWDVGEAVFTGENDDYSYANHIETGQLLAYSKVYKEADGERRVVKYFNKDGSKVFTVTLTSVKKNVEKKEGIVADYIWSHEENRALTREELLIRYFKNNLKEGDVVIKDDFKQKIPHVKRYLKVSSVKYYEVVHFDCFSGMFIDNIAKMNVRIPLIAANELVAERLNKLGFNATFIPPIFVEPNKEPSVISKGKRYVTASNLTPNKRVDMAIEAFNAVPDAELTIYGSNEDEIDKLKELVKSPNIKFAGFLENVPFEEYDFYLSCSDSECFSNACVEAMAKGCVPVLREIETPYAKYSLGQNLFTSSVDLATVIKDLKSKEVFNEPYLNLVEEYSFERVRRNYLEFLGLK